MISVATEARYSMHSTDEAGTLDFNLEQLWIEFRQIRHKRRGSFNYFVPKFSNTQQGMLFGWIAIVWRTSKAKLLGTTIFRLFRAWKWSRRTTIFKEKKDNPIEVNRISQERTFSNRNVLMRCYRFVIVILNNWCPFKQVIDFFSVDLKWMFDKLYL